MLVYISGQITGLPRAEAARKFSAAAEHMQSRGYGVINPMAPGVHKGAQEWEDYLATDLALLSHCDGIYMLPDWRESRGARLELACAKRDGLRVFFEDAEGERARARRERTHKLKMRFAAIAIAAVVVCLVTVTEILAH